jgi:hypothetical protein
MSEIRPQLDFVDPSKLDSQASQLEDQIARGLRINPQPRAFGQDAQVLLLDFLL